MKFLTTILFVFILSSFGCGEEKKCKYKPTPIFKQEWPNVKNYSFEPNGERSVEKLSLQNGIRLELFQTICNNAQQDYNFFLPGDLKNEPNEFWVNSSIQLFYNLASLGDEVRPLAAWGNKIKENPSKYILGENIEVGESKTIKIDKLIGIGESQLIITIAEKIE